MSFTLTDVFFFFFSFFVWMKVSQLWYQPTFILDGPHSSKQPPNRRSVYAEADGPHTVDLTIPLSFMTSIKTCLSLTDIIYPCLWFNLTHFMAYHQNLLVYTQLWLSKSPTNHLCFYQLTQNNDKSHFSHTHKFSPSLLHTTDCNQCCTFAITRQLHTRVMLTLTA